MSEAVRLVIWDLDETFWKGTLTEGGITYLQEHHDIVVALARRGIMSSICSKNDLTPVKELLTKAGLWDYFIFPSIDWSAKGARLAALVEAEHYVPGLQVADEHIIPTLLGSPLCKGKDDAALTRLAQYKLLETRHQAQAAAGDNREFLRGSNIRVTIEHDIAPHRDRVIELINRTNQLNFTKLRLPENAAAAELVLHRLCNDVATHAGLVHVEDDYGDYGFVGIYFLRSWEGVNRLVHFCFSCRTLGMGVEKWLYDHLGRPEIKVVGEVLTDLADDTVVIDWINAGGAGRRHTQERLAARIFMRGGCDMASAAHYLTLNADEVVGEFNIARDGLSVRLDHSVFLAQAMQPRSEAALAAAQRIGYQPCDFQSALQEAPRSFQICVLSFHNDARMAVYRHPETGLRVPFYQVRGNAVDNILQSELAHDAKTQALIQQMRVDGYEYLPPSVAAFRSNMQQILKVLHPDTKLFLVLGPETWMTKEGATRPLKIFLEGNRVLREFAAARPNSYLLNLTDFVEGPEDCFDYIHFGRMVYFRMTKHMVALLREAGGQLAA